MLTDFGDASQEKMPEDHSLVERAIGAIHALNEKYGQLEARTPFYFFHRKRIWNPNEGVWMGWERKRGKLHELNLLLRGKDGLSFSTVYGDSEHLPPITFIITLDADTILPQGAAKRMIGTLAHPLNRVLFEGDQNKVIDGYTILQPRIEIGPTSSNQSWFTRIFSGEAGLDLYTLAVSDPYQDLFGEGIYVGKGIYDIDGFERSTAGHVPENSLLSHDLLEGLLGRAGLVTDITLVEDYPPHYLVHAKRQHRWIRGDWQLLPWLFGRHLEAGKFSIIDRWKISDNLRRSLLMPALLLVLVLGWTYLPGSPFLWTIFPLIVLGVPVITSGLVGAVQNLRKEGTKTNFRPVGLAALRWLLAIVFLPYEAFIATDAILVTLYRLLISHRNMLQWTSAAHAIRTFRKQNTEQGIWQEMNVVLLVVNAVLIWIILKHPSALPAAAPLLFSWLLSPEVIRRISQPFKEREVALTEEQNQLLRSVARRTWAFFEQFVGPEDHWLPPDHFQESPLGMVGHRTSPTNIGLLLTSTLAAQDLGYLDQFNFITRLRATFDNLDNLERYRGHFLNWYDTRSLQPLSQRYVSTVDSGNLAAGLIVTAQACRQMRSVRIFRWQWWLGYLDTLKMLEEAIIDLKGEEVETQVGELSKEIDQLRADILSVKSHTNLWYDLFQRIVGQVWPDISRLLTEIVQTGSETLSQVILRGLLEVAKQVEIYHNGVGRTIQEVTPWIPMFQNIPEKLVVLFSSSDQQGELDLLIKNLPFNPELGRIAQITHDQIERIQKMQSAIALQNSSDVNIEKAAQWLVDLTNKLHGASANASLLLSGYYQLAGEAERYVEEMDFQFLYDPDRRVFHIGYNLDTTQLDRNYYDLLASEARIASIIAISKGDVPQQHWLHLNRPVTEVDRRRVLLSWSATMFEYIMPPLFLKSYPGTLLHESSQGAVNYQIEYGLSKGNLWGISESGFYRFDANQNYQYRAFGVPGLGFKRGLEDDKVIAPYASLMAVNFNPVSVYENIKNLIKHQMLGIYGFYEAIDFTQDRLTLGQKYAIVYSYMAHHQGMILLALDNYFNSNIMVERMHADVRIKSVEILLQEQIPYYAPIQNPESVEVSGLQRLSTATEEILPWSVPIYTPIPQVHLLSNGAFNSIISNSGSGFIQWQNIDLVRWRSDATLDPWGLWIYLQDMEMNSDQGLWSISNQPVPTDSVEMQVTNFPHKSVFRRNQHDIAAMMEVFVPPDESIEIRRVQVSNTGNSRRRLRLTSYGEVILNSQETDTRHPAFNKLFIESEYLPDLNTLIFWRRARSADEKTIFLGHMLVLENAQDYTGASKPIVPDLLGEGKITAGRQHCPHQNIYLKQSGQPSIQFFR